MKKQSQFANKICFSIILIIALTGCLENECNCYDDFPPLPIIDNYFSNYTNSNNSWLYSNFQGSKTDSIYLTNDWNSTRNGKFIEDGWECRYSYYWKKIMHSNYILNDTLICEYKSGGSKKEEKILWWNSLIKFETRNNINLNWECYAEYGVDTMLIGSYEKKYKYKKDKLTLPNNITYNDVISIDNTLWFAANIGLIQFVSFNKVDTFYLQKFYKK
ncbi:MAG TPA: hypothetical protein P5084_05045 [Paludibacter sp.]|nr:hypothetical protein [Paludibacter sp.]